MKVLFYGTPQTAVPYLELLARRETVLAAVTQPDKPAGRSLKTAPTPVKAKALELGLPVLAPASSSELWDLAKELKPDLGVAVAYGRMLKPQVLALPRLGTLNVHFSLLPRHRGAAPVQWSLVRGESRTGVTLFWLDEGLDTGPIFLKRELEIGPDEDAASLMERLKALGLDALEEGLAELAAGRIRREPQSGPASLAPLIDREDARIVWGLEAREIHNLVRGMRLWPRAYLDLERPSGGLRILVLKTVLSQERGSRAPGTILRVEPGKGFLIQCNGSSCLWFLTVQPEGKKPISAADFLNGLRLGAGDFLPIKAGA
ncbi:MAG: methionyl-tRNA formyltransferase [Elusimicrobia bacterium]|nr:methionyl-tRNA formyltransferase [Elusimicrobiota bacterium]